MNILVTGANGQLGNHIRLASKASKHRYVFTDVEELDITDAAAVELMAEREKIECIINCAAYTNVDKAEEDEQTADQLNHKAVGILAKEMRKREGLLVHISTDYVFGGEGNNTPYREEQEKHPTSAYGRTKWAGEQAIAEAGCKSIVIRTAWLYSEYGKNFVKTMMTLTGEKKELKVVFDQVGSPTYAGDLAAAICQIVEDEGLREKTGVYHYSNEGVCSWYDFAKEIAAQAGHGNCEIAPCHSDEFASKVQRPNYSVLDKTKIKNTFGLKVPYWTDSLKICINNLTK